MRTLQEAVRRIAIGVAKHETSPEGGTHGAAGRSGTAHILTVRLNNLEELPPP